jgi:predicted CxxxxCH...CXXCH cytochrome family protein
VNGVRDVAFDARAAYAGSAAGVPQLPAGAVLRPYYLTNSFLPLDADDLHADAEILDSSPQVLSMFLASARYDAGTRTCTNVACHMARQGKVDAGFRPLQWGAQVADSCSGCHTK